MIKKYPNKEYDRLFRIVLIAAVTSFAVLLIFLIVLFTTRALSGGKSGNDIVIVTGDGTSTSGSGTEADTKSQTELNKSPNNSGLLFPGGDATPAPNTNIETQPDEDNTKALETADSAQKETTPPETEPIKISDDNSSIPRYSGLGGIEKEFPGTVLTLTDDMGEEYIKQIVFLGDSLTYGLKSYGILEGGRDTKQVWVPSNGTLLLNDVADAKILFPETGTEITVRHAIQTKKPEIMIVALGINGISYLNEDSFISQISSLITEIKKESPDTIIILQSMFPVASSYKLQNSINNNKICRGNYWMARAANENSVYYLNTAEVLVNADGYLSEDMQSGDGLHISTAAYKTVLDYIKTHGAPLN